MPRSYLKEDVSKYFTCEERHLLKITKITKPLMEFCVRNKTKWCSAPEKIILKPIMDYHFIIKGKKHKKLPECCEQHQKINWDVALSWAVTYAPQDLGITYAEVFLCLPRKEIKESGIYY